MYDINILPPNMRRKKKKIKIGNPTYAPFLLAGVLASIVFLNIQLEAKIKDVEEERSEMESTISELQSNLDEVRNLVDDIQFYKRELSGDGTTSGGLTQSMFATTPWDLMLDELAGSTPPEVTILDITGIDSEGKIKVSAETYTLTNMGRFEESLSSNPYFGEVELLQFNQEDSTLLRRPSKVTFEVKFTYIENPDTSAEVSEGETSDSEINSDAELDSLPDIPPNISNLPREREGEGLSVSEKVPAASVDNMRERGEGN